MTAAQSRRAAGTLCALCALAAACSPADRRADGRAAAGAGTAPGVAAGGSATTGPGGLAPGRSRAACPHDGRWRACSVTERLDQAGLVPRADTAPALRVPFLSGRDTVLRLGRGALHAFIYDDTARLARDVAALDTVRVAPRGGAFAWGDAPPTLVRSANLVAVLLTPNERQIERVQLALQAGPPQRNPDAP